MTRISSRALGIGIVSVACALFMTACQTTDTSSSSESSGPIQETEGGFRAPTEPAPDSGGGTQTGPKLELRPVYFVYDRSDLTSEARASLREDGAALRNSMGATMIEGHTDARGTLEYNLALGDRRANVVKKYLVALGLSAKDLRTKSFGEMSPAVKGNDETAWRWNRRVVLRH